MGGFERSILVTIPVDFIEYGFMTGAFGFVFVNVNIAPRRQVLSPAIICLIYPHVICIHHTFITDLAGTMVCCDAGVSGDLATITRQSSAVVLAEIYADSSVGLALNFFADMGLAVTGSVALVATVARFVAPVQFDISYLAIVIFYHASVIEPEPVVSVSNISLGLDPCLIA